MNELTEALAKQAAEYAIEVAVKDQELYIPKLMEKFSELIIQQCGYYADVFAALGCPVDMDPTETKASDYIKKHFGVKE
jgi:hypothetical protein